MDANRMMDVSGTLMALHDDVGRVSKYLDHLGTELESEDSALLILANSAIFDAHNVIVAINDLAKKLYYASIAKGVNNDRPVQ